VAKSRDQVLCSEGTVIIEGGRADRMEGGILDVSRENLYFVLKTPIGEIPAGVFILDPGTWSPV